ncbi:uncharacterized protein [Procambarus clarkii]|uniref:uncharacterized protein n=1 Tax=Procambarus clarkii TaxID=6728 RepID=UPI001E670E30|nr:uncharacterized protein LOC123768171 [Procambarus clarkii]
MSLRVLMLAACVAVTLGSILPPKPNASCTNYCPDPIKGHGFFVCCDPHPGFCPPKRFVCPFAKFPSPPKCVTDFNCPKTSKCCEDACLNFKTCKPAVYS